MYEISIKCSIKDADMAIEKLQLVDIYNVFYESPIVITTTDYGYDYYENENELTTLKIIVEDTEDNNLDYYLNTIKNILNVDKVDVKKLQSVNLNNLFDPIDLGNGWIIADPNFDSGLSNKINFVSQGAFGTGLHETTQDCLRFILNSDLKDKDVLDLGTGSGILSIAASINKAASITAVDIRDVKPEIEFNASLNEINNIEILVGNALNNEISLNKNFDYIIINIGGEELLMFMEFINKHIKNHGRLLVSGLVQWSFDRVIEEVVAQGYKLEAKKQTNEWCTCILSRI